MHEERVERHCAGIEEAIESMQKQFVSMQNQLNEQANQNRSHVLDMEVAFNTASKSIRLVALQGKRMYNLYSLIKNIQQYCCIQVVSISVSLLLINSFCILEQLAKQRDKHMELVKATLRNFRAKFDDSLAYLRNSNAKFRFSFK